MWTESQTWIQCRAGITVATGITGLYALGADTVDVKYNHNIENRVSFYALPPSGQANFVLSAFHSTTGPRTVGQLNNAQ